MDKGSERPWTPGPWQVNIEADRIVVFVSGLPNARLILSCIELYEALEELKAWSFHGKTPAERGCKCDSWIEVTEKVDAALSKANPKEEGGEHDD